MKLSAKILFTFGFAIAIGLISVKARACPDINGTFSCTDKSKKFDIQIQTLLSSEKATYNLDGQVIEANEFGITRESSEMGFLVKMTGNCSDNLLELFQQVLTTTSNIKIGESRSTYVLAKPGELRISFIVIDFSATGQTPIFKEISCSQN